MRELTADLFISLDGFASGKNEAAYFGYDGPDLAAWIGREGSQPQVLLMGRNTYTTFASFVPTATDPVSTRLNALPKLIFSNTLTEPLGWHNSTVLRGDLAQQIHAIKQEAGDPIRSIGSVQLVKGLLQRGLVDRLRLMIFPLILGKGGEEPIFAELQRTELRLINTTVLDARLVLLQYGP